MSQTYGIEAPSAHHGTPQQPPVRYVIVIDSGETSIARLLLDTRSQIAEFDAGTPEVVQMIQGRAPAKAGLSPEWDNALRGHSALERSRADVYTLDV